MPVKPPTHRIAREAADVPSKWRWAWRDLFALIPLSEGPGLFTNLVNGEIGTQNGGTPTIQDGLFGREVSLPSRAPWIEFTTGGVFPYADGSAIVLGTDSKSAAAASWISSRSTGPYGVWLDAEVYNDTGNWGLGIGSLASYEAFSTPTVLRPVGAAWTQGGTVRFFDRTFGYKSLSIGTGTAPDLQGMAVGTTHYNSASRGIIDGTLALVAVLKHADDAWVSSLVADPVSWLTRRRVFAMKAPAATGYSSSFFRENAGLGAAGAGPFARANAGLGAIA